MWGTLLHYFVATIHILCKFSYVYIVIMNISSVIYHVKMNIDICL